MFFTYYELRPLKMYIILQKTGETEPIIITYSSVFFCLNTLFRDATKEQSERSSKAEF